MASNRGNRSGRRPGPRRNRIWTNVLSDEGTVGGGGSLTLDITRGTDWQRSGTGREMATVVAIRGWISFAFEADSIAGGSLSALIGLFDEDEANPGVTVVATYSDEDILWTGGIQLGSQFSNEGQAWNVEFNVKAKRKLSNGQELRFIMENGCLEPCRVSGLLRALILTGSAT